MDILSILSQEAVSITADNTDNRSAVQVQKQQVQEGIYDRCNGIKQSLWYSLH